MGGRRAKLLISLGDLHTRELNAAKVISQKLEFYLFARIFEGSDSAGNESGIHKHITEIERAKPIQIHGFGAQLRTVNITPTAAIINIGLDDYNRLRSIGRGGSCPFPPYTRLES
jgi:hypothetical protein